jgi:hypothetical protein
MPGRWALSAHGAGKLIVKTDGQTKTEKDTYAKLCDDTTQVNANVKAHMDQLKAMYESDEFPEIEKQVPLTDERFETSDSNSRDPSNAKARKSKKKKSKLSNGWNSTKCQ